MERRLSKVVDEAVSLCAQSRAFREAGRPIEGRDADRQAVALFDQVLAESPGNPRALIGKAVCLRQMGELVAAQSLLEHAVALKPENTEGNRQLGLCQLELGEIYSGATGVRAALDLDPDDTCCNKTAAEIYRLGGRLMGEGARLRASGYRALEIARYRHALALFELAAELCPELQSAQRAAAIARDCVVEPHLVIFGQATEPASRAAVGALAPSASVVQNDRGLEVEWPALSVRIYSVEPDEVALHRQGVEALVDGVPGAEALVERINGCSVVQGLVVGTVRSEEPCNQVRHLAQALADFQVGVYFDGHAFYDGAGAQLLRLDQAPTAASVEPPSALRVARRALVLCAITWRGLVEVDPPADAEGLRCRVGLWLRSIGADVEIDPDEQRVLDAPIGELAPQLRIDASWRAEGLAVLAWALGANDLPDHDIYADVTRLHHLLGFMRSEPPVLESPLLPDGEAIDWLQRRLLAIHWRLREYSLEPRAIDFVEAAESTSTMGFDAEGIPLADGDLALEKAPIDRAPPDLVSRCYSIASERHQAINWLLGRARAYADVETTT